MPPLVRKIEPGDIIGRCRAVRELGRGGVGTVFLATHQTLQIEVALKVLSPALSMDNPALAERFIREAQLAARIRHPNVIAVMDAAHDEATDLYYIVMEYVGGGSLSWHLQKGPMPEAKALSIVTGIAHALVIAEEKRIVHRDIKPDNIMLDLRGTAKLADLGLAKHTLDSNISLTLGGSFMGTPAYMSPDQARDAKVADTRDDIYSLGASFYECLTGQPPFQGETPYNIMHELLTKPTPRPCALRPGLSRSADLICRKMMAKSRELRYADAHALLKDLQHASMHGDNGLDQLEAAELDRDVVSKQAHETSYGIETSADGVYAEDEQVENRPIVPVIRGAPLARQPRHANHDVFSAAALLIILVVMVTLLFAWARPNHLFAYLRKEINKVAGISRPSSLPPILKTETETKSVPAVEIDKTSPTPSAVPEQPRPTLPPTLPSVVAPPIPAVTPLSTDTTNLPPIALPESLVNATNAAGLNPSMPTAPVEHDSAFTARDTAEQSLPTSDIAPTGKAEMLRVIGERTIGQPTPASWKYYFFDQHASGHARIVTVTAGKVSKSGEDLADFASPYEEEHIMPEDKLLIDSSQALQIAEGLVPGVSVDSAEFALTQSKNSVPMWKVTLWTRRADGEDRKLGDVTLRAENGVPFSIKLSQ